MAIEINSVLGERETTHGDFTSNSTLTMELLQICKRQLGFKLLPKPIQFAIFMILHKISRAVCGDHQHSDHWVDVQGYASLAMNASKAGGNDRECEID